MKGPKGTLTHTVAEPDHGRAGRGRHDHRRPVPDDERESKSLHGLSRTLIANMVTGVTEGYTKTPRDRRHRLPRRRPRAATSSSRSASRTRCSSPAPEGITFRVEAPTRFAVEGIDKQKVGEVAANIRKLRKPDPYKGKGVRYQGEDIRRKAGKAGKK